MKRFAELYAKLDATTSTREKLEALIAHFAHAAPADAAWAVYFLSGKRPKRVVPARVLRALAIEAAGVPAWLFEESYQAVGDLAETIALLLPEPARCASDRGEVSLADWVERRLLPLRDASEDELRGRLLAYWDELDTRERFVWNKLVTGGFRVGVSKQLVVRALASAAGLEPDVVAERLAGEWRPGADAYVALVAPGGRTTTPGKPYPFFLAHPLPGSPASLGSIEAWQADWKWDGIRAQVIARNGQVFVWSRGEDLVTDRFPEIVAAARCLPDGTVLDGEIAAWREGKPLPFTVLQRRIGRKSLGPKVLAEAPAAFLAYDALEHAGRDIRGEPLAARRAALEALLARQTNDAIVLPPLVHAEDWDTLAARRDEARARGVEGLMLKRRDSAYGIGRTRGDWWKWKIDPYSVDAVLVYAQRGHGRRASLYTDYTFAVWDAGTLVPFAKAYSGLSDAEIREVDAFIRRNTFEKFGPVRSVTPALVMEIGFEGIARSSRHKSGIAVRFPRMLRLRRDKAPDEADSIEALRTLAGE